MLRFDVHRQFIESWQNLAEDERKAVQRLLRLLENGDITPGMRPHKVGAFLSLSPNMDLRVIASTAGSRTILLHVGHHDAAYQWAKNRSVLKTQAGSIELIDIIAILPSLKETTIDGYVLPIPIQDILGIDNDDMFLQAITDMSPEWQEWLLSSYKVSGNSIPPPVKSSLVFCPTDDTELTKALELELPAWHLFLHPVQREAVNDLSSTSIAVTGGPGTGKTVVLLNRILSHAPKSNNDEECTILLTYSPGLARYLHKKLRDASNRQFHVYPLYMLGGRRPPHVSAEAAYKKVRFEIEDGKLFHWFKNKQRTFVRELLVDEFQDIPPEVAENVKPLINAGSTRVIVASDVDQSIFRINRTYVDSPIELCQQRYDLIYCYRSTRQIIETANKWFSSFGIASSNNSLFALSGPAVRFVECVDLAEQVDVSTQVLLDLQNRYDQEDLALIYCQYYLPNFKGQNKEEDSLKDRPILKRVYHVASSTKGKEFFAGVLFVSNTFLARNLAEQEKRLRINTLYVALTRFRDEVTIVYPKGCVIERYLKDMNQIPLT